MMSSLFLLTLFAAQIPERALQPERFTIEFKPNDFLAEGDSCDSLIGKPGICSKIENCPELVPSIKNGIHPPVCSFDKYQSIVCCQRPVLPDKPSDRPSTDQITVVDRSRVACNEHLIILRNLMNASTSAQCEEFYYDGPGIVGGEPALPREFPHMAALGFGVDGNNVRWSCGGSLISRRYVLTAGHCLSLRSVGPVQWVRLGDLDLYSNSDDAKPQQFSVTERHAHPDYRPPSQYNDIALLRLDRDVIYNTYMRPACLNTEVDLLDNVGVATGWGVITFAASAGSDILMKATLPVQPAQECVQGYNSLTGGLQLATGFDDESMLCVGDRQGEKDTCKGDSGGPYHKEPQEYPECLHVIAGVTSFGKPVCKGVNSPAVYTRVSKFVPWIETIVWP